MVVSHSSRDRRSVSNRQSGEPPPSPATRGDAGVMILHLSRQCRATVINLAPVPRPTRPDDSRTRPPCGVSSCYRFVNTPGRRVGRSFVKWTTSHQIDTARVIRAACPGIRAACPVIRSRRSDIRSGCSDIRLGSSDIRSHSWDITEGRRDITEGRRDITASRRDITEGRRDITASRRDITEGSRDITEGRRDITEGRRDITASRRDITEVDRRPISVPFLHEI